MDVVRLYFYTARQLLPWLLITLACAAFAFVTSQLLRVAPVLLGSSAGPADLLGALGLLLVPVMGWALTPAYVIAVFAAAGGMSASGEQVALDAAGISRARTGTGPLLVAALLVILCAGIWVFWAPASQAGLRRMAVEMVGNALLGKIEPGRIAAPVPGLTFLCDRRRGDVFEGVFLEDGRDPRGSVQLVAKGATIRREAGDRSVGLEVREGRLFWGGQGADPVMMDFEKLEFHVSLSDEIERKLDFLPPLMAYSSRDLLGPPPPDQDPARWGFALWRRVGSVAGFAVMAVVATFLAFGVTWRRRGWAVFAAAILFLGYHLAARLGETLLDGGQISAPVAAMGGSILVVAGVVGWFSGRWCIWLVRLR